MTKNLEKAIDNFMSYLSAVNKLHHPSDYRRLRKIALEAVREGDGIPREEMEKAFQREIEEQNLPKEPFEGFYQKYISTIGIMYDTLMPLQEKGLIPDDFNY